MTRKHVVVPLANGVEEIEAVIIIDTLRRADMEVVVAGIPSRRITASRGVVLMADVEWDSLTPSLFDAIVLPGGGPGTRLLMSTPSVLAAVRHLASADRLVGAICAAPLVLQKAGILRDKRATCHPTVANEMTVPTLVAARVVIDANIVTSQGPGTAIEFALTLVSLLTGPDAAHRIGNEMLVATPVSSAHSNAPH